MDSENSQSLALQNRPFFPCLSQNDFDLLKPFTYARIHQLGIHVSGKKFAYGNKKTPSSVHRTPGKSSGSSMLQQRIFCRPLRDLSMVMVDPATNKSIKKDVPGEENEKVMMVPKFLVTVCEWLLSEERLKMEGIFRRSGSSVRQKQLRESMETSENWRLILAEANVIDVANLLKAWLRELPEPLITPQVLKLLKSSWHQHDVSSKQEALLLSLCLLPVNHIATLVYLLRFFKEIAVESGVNKMDLSNLSIVITPNILLIDEDQVSGGSSISKKLGNEKFTENTLIMKWLLINSDQVGYASESVSQAFAQASSIPMLPSHSEDNLDASEEELHVGPLARRRRKKKRRSASMSRVLTATVKGLQKAMSRSTTPVAPRKTQDDTCYNRESSLHFTPYSRARRDELIFNSPRMPPAKKKTVGSDMKTSLDTRFDRKIDLAFTPKVRGRSFSVKKFKGKKDIHGDHPLPTFQAYSQLTPLPSKPPMRLEMETPKTPVSLNLPHSGCDIKTPKEIIPMQGTNEVDMPSLCGKPQPFPDLSDSEDSDLKEEKSLHPEPDFERPATELIGERKLGETRKRSRKNLQHKNNGTAHEEVSWKLQSMKRQLHNEHCMENSSFNKSADATKPLNDSLNNLKNDISSFIEKSFSVNGFDNEGGKKDGFDLMEPKISKKAIKVPYFLRRQSSAFEFSRPDENQFLPREMRRQSSAFEIAAKNRQHYGGCSTEDQSFGTRETRSSLRRKSSSVKDLVKKLEASKLKSSHTVENWDNFPTTKNEMRETLTPLKKEDISNFDNLNEQREEEWVDAADFFNNPITPYRKVYVEEDSYGCKRSSIIRIRTERKGLVSRSVQNFTNQPITPICNKTAKEAMPPPSTFKRTNLETPKNGRRLSARMGVSTRMPVITPTKKADEPRRQTLTGIRTTTTRVKGSPYYQATSKRLSIASDSKKNDLNRKDSPLLMETSSPKSTNLNKPKKVSLSGSRKNLDKKLKRSTGRHLTIAYPGEIRSPLKEKQNTVATVQRSKSAQTPVLREKRKKASQESGNVQNHPMVRRSNSLYSSPGDPKAMRTDRRTKVQRNRSVNSPAKYIQKNRRESPRVKMTPVASPSITTTCR